MQTVTSTKFVQNFGQLNFVVQREPIAVTSHGRVTGYFVSAHEYEELLKLKNSQRQSFTAAAVPDDVHQAIMNSRVDPKYDHLNALLDNQKPMKP